MPRLDDGTGWQGTETSREAAVAAQPSARTIRLAVLNLLTRSVDALTTAEIAARLNKPECSVQPRISELRSEGKVKDSGIRRMGRYNVRVSAWTVTHRSPNRKDPDHA